MNGGYHSLRDHRGDVELDCDVVVVGSGAGGATVATELATSGQRVIVLEEGPRVEATEYGAMRPSESLRHVWRDGGMTLVMGLGDSPSVNVTTGRVVGGSSVVTGGVCFRTPDKVLAEWRERFGLAEYTPEAMQPYFEHVEKHLHVEEVPVEARSRSTELFAIGAERLGRPVASIRRNTRGCNGCGRCNFGCPHGAKMSVDLSYLPRAVAGGADVWSHALVERVLTRGGRAIGVEGRLLNRPGAKAGDRLTVRARRVVLACGGMHTPLLLRASGLGKRGKVGHGLTLHPSFRVIAAFEERVEGWKGALQAAFSKAFDADELTLVGVFVPVGVLAATMPGFGPTHTLNARKAPHLAMFGGMIRDRAGGVVRRGFGREPIGTYRMAREDRARIPRILRALGDTFVAAGAKELFVPVLGLPRGLTPDEFRKFDFEGVHGRRLECSSQHPLGTARMAADPTRGVVDPDGKSWDAEDLYVVDGSALPTSLGVNPQETIMSVATRQAWRMREKALV